MKEAFTEFSEEILRELKARGYNSVQIVPKDDKKNHHCTIELVPSKSPDFQLDHIHLDSREIKDYIDQQSPLVKYIINSTFLEDRNST